MSRVSKWNPPPLPTTCARADDADLPDAAHVARQDRAAASMLPVVDILLAHPPRLTNNLTRKSAQRLTDGGVHHGFLHL